MNAAALRFLVVEDHGCSDEAAHAASACDSSVQQLGPAAFTEQNIDQSFVRDAAGREAAMILLQASLDMARGCFIAPAMAAARVPGWREEHRRRGPSAMSGAQ